MDSDTPRNGQATCRRCHRQLKVVRHHDADGQPLGPVCAKRERQAAAVAAVKPDTLAKAVEDIEDGAIVDTRKTTRTGHRVFEVVSSTGTGTYLATVAGCTCRAGHKGNVCRHRVAATLIAA